MKYNISLPILLTLVSFGFTSTTVQHIAGVFGTCDAECSCVQLTLLEDNSFTFIDKTGSTTPSKITGKWHIKGEVISLQSSEEKSYHNKWKLSKDGESIRSRKDVLFYTLRRTQ